MEGEDRVFLEFEDRDVEVSSIGLSEEFLRRRVLYQEYMAQFSSRYSRNRYLRNEVYERDGYECLACGESEVSLLSLDHVVPKSRGGGSLVSNLQTLCKSCNERKGDRTIDYRGRRL
jgi:5-methylcytosine-specific restriction endonuclease McrA